MLLLLTSEEHQIVADRVGAECDRRGVPHLRLYTEKFPQEIMLALKPGPNGLSGMLQTPERVVPIEAVTGVWHYLAGGSRPGPDLDEMSARLVQQESDQTLKGLYLALDDRRWVNPPHPSRSASYRIYQLRLAAQIGFRTPRTLVTNAPDDALVFLEQCGGQVVYKPVDRLLLDNAEGEPAFVTYVTRITRADMDAHLTSIPLSPCLFQEFIPKRCDLTVYAIGRHVWAAAIDSQAETVAHKVDYRKNGRWSCPHTPALLPPALERMCLEMTGRMGLRMCHFDLALTPEGDYVFLDANPTDLWAAIEDLVGFPLCAAVVDELLGVDTLDHHPYLADRSIRFSAAPLQGA